MRDLSENEEQHGKLLFKVLSSYMEDKEKAKEALIRLYGPDRAEKIIATYEELLKQIFE